MRQFFKYVFPSGLLLISASNIFAWTDELVPFPSTGMTVARELTDKEAVIAQQSVDSCWSIVRHKLRTAEQVAALNTCVSKVGRALVERGDLPLGTVLDKFTDLPPANGGF